MKDLNIGIDVGGTNIKIGVIKPDGKIIKKVSIPTLVTKEHQALIEYIVRNTKLLLYELKICIDEIESLGLGIPGTVDSHKGVVVYAPNIFWKNVNVKNAMEPLFEKQIHIAQDSRAAAWAEYNIGTGKKYSDIVSITLGTGIGCGIVINNKIHNGGLNTAGELGHHIVDVDGYQCHCGKRGCLETYIGGPAILRNALMNKRLKKKLQNVIMAGPTVADIYKMAENGDPDAMSVTQSVVRHLSIGLVNLINILSPQLITISGGISNANNALLIGPLKSLINNLIYEPIANKVEIVKSQLKDDAPMIGASLLYKQDEYYGR